MRPTSQKAIVEAARLEFAERGYGAASIRDIARRAGVSLSALYHYYPGKQDLLVAILDEVLDSYFDSCAKALAAAGDTPAERLTALVSATVRFRIEHPAKSNLVVTEERSLEPEHIENYRRRAAGGSTLFQEAVQAGVEAGVFTTPYPDDARRAVLAACNAVAQWYRPDGEVGPDELVDRYVALALTIVGYRSNGG